MMSVLAKSSLLTVFCGELTENHRENRGVRVLLSLGCAQLGQTYWLTPTNVFFAKGTPHRMKHGRFEFLHIVKTEN